MLSFPLYGTLGVLLTLFLAVTLLLLAAAIFYSVRRHAKPAVPASEDEHADPGIPLVLKILYVAIALYIVAATAYVAVTGMKIG